MYYVSLLAIALFVLLAFCLLMACVGNGFRFHEEQGGPVIRDRLRRGVIRFPENPNDREENYVRVLR